MGMMVIVPPSYAHLGRSYDQAYDVLASAWFKVTIQ